MKQTRFYRNWVASDLINFTVVDNETDISISAERNLENETKKLVRRYRKDIVDYIKRNPGFETSLKPLPGDDNAPGIIKAMLKAGLLAGVGPMAAVAGAISEFVGKGLLRFTSQVILENGGDIFIKTTQERKIGIYAGTSSLSKKIAIKIKPGVMCGVCTSSGTIGHSLSFGKADAVILVAQDTIIADAVATATCNRVKNEADIEAALNFAKNIEGVIGAMVIYREKIGSIGDIELILPSPEPSPQRGEGRVRGKKSG
ncbi:MAG: UPF0280 family protein [Candidatus Omnitrophota bacterium]|nr:MAG: UPF0280 family protein [Candidatus Omnitrophota bacterium]